MVFSREGTHTGLGPRKVVCLISCLKCLLTLNNSSSWWWWQLGGGEISFKMRGKKKEKSKKEKDKTKISITATDREGEVNGPTWGPSSEDQSRQHVPGGKGPIRSRDRPTDSIPQATVLPQSWCRCDIMHSASISACNVTHNYSSSPTPEEREKKNKETIELSLSDLHRPFN